MSRLALVTGGTRGIGTEISKILKKQGCNVVALYVGHQQAAAQFSTLQIFLPTVVMWVSLTKLSVQSVLLVLGFETPAWLGTKTKA